MNMVYDNCFAKAEMAWKNILSAELVLNEVDEH